MERTPSSYGRLRPLIEGHLAGHYPLPEPLLDAWRAAERVVAEGKRPVPDRTRPTFDALVDQLDQAAVAGADMTGISGRPVVDAQADDQGERTRQEALDRVLVRRVGALVALVEAGADELVRSCLRPAFYEVVTEARRCAGVIGDHVAGDPYRAPDKVRKAFLALVELSDRYIAVRKARRLLSPTRVAGADAFVEVRNMHEVWPTYRRRGAEPWPTGGPDAGRRRLIWLVTTKDPAAPDLWLPVGAEADAWYQELHADSMAAMKRGRQGAEAVKAAS